MIWIHGSEESTIADTDGNGTYEITLESEDNYIVSNSVIKSVLKRLDITGNDIHIKLLLLPESLLQSAELYRYEHKIRCWSKGSEFDFICLFVVRSWDLF